MEYEDEQQRKEEAVVERRTQLQAEHDAEALRKKAWKAKELQEEKGRVEVAAAEAAKFFAEEDEKQRKILVHRKEEVVKQKKLAEERQVLRVKAKQDAVASGLVERQRLQREEVEEKKQAEERRRREQLRQERMLQEGILRKRAKEVARLKEFKADEAMNAAIEREHEVKEDAEKAEWHYRQEFATGMATWFMEFGGVEVYHPHETEAELMARVAKQRAAQEASVDDRRRREKEAHSKEQAVLVAQNAALISHQRKERLKLESAAAKERAPLELEALKDAEAERKAKALAMAEERKCKAEILEQVQALKAARRDDMTTADRSLNKGRLAALDRLGQRDPERVVKALGRFPQAGKNMVPAVVRQPGESP